MERQDTKNKNRRPENNKGSATVEMCIIMPIVFLIIIMCLSLLLGSVTDIKAQEMSYVAIYTFPFEGGQYESQVAIYEEKGELCGRMPDVKGLLNYRSKSIVYKTEYDKCTSRLRRWQLYGDIFQE